MPIGTSRLSHRQLTHYFRKRVNWNDAGIAAGVLFGTLPAGTILVGNFMRVNVAFNAATTNALNVGTAPGGAQIFTDAATAGSRQPAIPNLIFAVDTDLFVQYAQTGAVATAGQADFCVAYIPNNDQ